MPKKNEKENRAVLTLVFLLLVLVVVVFIKLSPFFGIFFNKEIELKKENDRINVLLLGIGGGTHDGPNLTDTIIFASIDSAQNKVVLVSIPRDLWIKDLRSRINVAYAKGGISMAKAASYKAVGQPIDYVLQIDFEGFEKAVDLLGGVDVNVPNTFDDFEYPIFGKENDPCGRMEEELETLATASSQLEAFPCRYMRIHFDKGLQHMDGETALQYVRSRHAEGSDGTDFARSKRQVEVVGAVKDKVFSVETLLNPAKVFTLYSVVKNSIDTNIKEEEFDDFIKLANTMKDASIQSVVLDYGDEKQKKPGLLVNPPISKDYGNQWVLIPRIGNGDFSEIQKYVECEIKIGNCPISEEFTAK